MVFSRLLSFVLRLLSRLSLSGGVLGLALGAALYAYYKQKKRLHEDGGARTASDRVGVEPASPEQAFQDLHRVGRDSSLELRLSRVSSIVVSVGGVLVHERTPEELSTQGASLVDSAVEVVKEMIGLKKDVFLVCEVEDDIGQAVVSDALEHAGIVGETAHAQVPFYRVIFCNSAASKVSIARQIEPSIYIDIDGEICKELCRFLSVTCLSEAGSLRQSLTSRKC
ncbi:hypothetical protein M9435_006884 [Picochlorum sp. BPE23]|nr:hypothetical protein M9435_006884 [Picochlorum sp. BPE23]